MKSKMRDVVVVGVCEEERMTKRVMLGDLFAILFPPREKARNVFFFFRYGNDPRQCNVLEAHERFYFLCSCFDMI
jgi:hypothetical protein